LVLILALSAVAKDKKTDGLQISGFVGLNETQPASNTVLKLLDGESGKVMGMVETGFFGKYKFENLKPGLYVIQVKEFKTEVLLRDKNKRLDFDLSAKDGIKRGFTAEKVLGALNAGGGTVTPGSAPGPNDQSLMASFSGHFRGYSGSTEVNLTLCPNGLFAEQSEFSASGRMSDSTGGQTGAWGTASQGGSRGNWSIQGDLQQGTIVLAYANGKRQNVPYRVVDSAGASTGAHCAARVPRVASETDYGTSRLSSDAQFRITCNCGCRGFFSTGFAKRKRLPSGLKAKLRPQWSVLK
jgi:hypothetical protein